MRRRQANPPLDARCRKPGVDLGHPVAEHGHGGVPIEGVVVDGPLPVRRRMAAPHDQRQPVAREGLADEAGRQRRPGHGQAEVDLALLHPGHDVAPDRREGEIDAGRLALQPGDKTRRDQDRLGVGGGQTEGPL